MVVMPISRKLLGFFGVQRGLMEIAGAANLGFLVILCNLFGVNGIFGRISRCNPENPDNIYLHPLHYK
jgi:hypothetical protein